MANDTIIRVSVDASGVEAGTERVIRSLDAYMAKQSEVAALTITKQKAVDEAVANGSQASVRQINSFMQSLDKLSITYGRSKSELLTLQAAQLGVSGTAQPLIDKVAAMEAAMKGAGASALAMAESETEATARIAAMVAASLEATAALTSSTEAADRYAASVDAMAAAATVAERANTGIAASAEAAATSQAAVAVQFKAASTTISEGAAKVTEALGRQLTALTATEAEMAVYDAQMAGMTEAETAQIGEIAKEIELRKQQIKLGAEMAATYEAEAVASGHAAKARGTSGVTSEGFTLLREGINGNYTRLAGSFTRFLSLAGALDLLLNPLSLSIAAVGGAMLYVAHQNEQMNEALAMTGGYAGITADQLRNAATAATANGASFSTAATAVTELAATGRLTGDEIANLGKTAADAATYTSISVQKMVDDFTKLAEEPVKASVKLNDQYHYLTAATYDQIAALEKQGDATGAAKVAVEAFSSAMDERTKEIAANEGIILKGWRDIKSAISDAIEAVGSFGAAATPGQVVARLQDNKTARLPIGQWSSDDEAELQKAIATRDAAIKAAQDKARTARQAQEVIDAKHAYDTFNTQFATPAEKRAKEIRTYLDTIAGPLNLSPEQQLADEQKISDKYKDPKTAKPKAYRDDSGTRMLQQLRDQQAALEAQLSTTGKLSTAESELAKFNQQISDWKNKTLTTAQQSLINDQDAIRAQLQKNVELEKEVQHHQDITKLQERSAQIQASIASYQKGQTEQHNRQLDAFGMGADAQQQVQAVKSIYAEYQRQMDQLNKSTAPDLIGGDKYNADVANIKAGLDQSLADYDAYYTALKAKQADWSNGATTAFADYVDAAKNTAKQSQEVFTSVFKGVQDTLTQFVETGKLNFQSLADSILKSITGVVSNRLTAQFLDQAASLGGNFFSSHTNVAASAANAMGGDPLDNMLKLTKGFGTSAAGDATKALADASKPMNVAQMQTAMQQVSALTTASATVATMTVGTMIGGNGGGGGGGSGDALGGLLNGLGNGQFAGSFGFTATGVTGSTDAVASGVLSQTADTGGSASALMGLGGALATGGPVDSGTPYLVGEKGPELFMPSQSGRVIPNHAINMASPSDSGPRVGARTSNFNMNISVPPGTTRQTAQQQAAEIMRHAQIAMARNG